MTKMQLSFDLVEPLDNERLMRIADLYKIYGILRVTVEPGGGKLTVEYDATRFNSREVAAVLAQSGLPLAEFPVE
jgi:hypothetical protein